MRRTAAAASSLVLGAALAACAGGAQPSQPAVAGDIGFDATGTVAVHVPLEWPAYDVRNRDGPVTYELRVWHANGPLPGDEAARVRDIRGTRVVLADRLPRGDYVWSVRAHFVRDGWPCVSGWYFIGLTADDRLLPRRAFAPLPVR